MRVHRLILEVERLYGQSYGKSWKKLCLTEKVRPGTLRADAVVCTGKYQLYINNFKFSWCKECREACGQVLSKKKDIPGSFKD